MACGEYGRGKFLEPLEISNKINDYFKNLEENKKFSALVTAGPTREYIDSVRYITNKPLENKDMQLQKSFKEAAIIQHLYLDQQV